MCYTYFFLLNASSLQGCRTFSCSLSMFSAFQDSWPHLLKSLDKPNAIILLYVCRTESDSVWLGKKSSNCGFSSLNLILPRLLSLQLWNFLYLGFTTSKTEVLTSCSWVQGTKYTIERINICKPICAVIFRLDSGTWLWMWHIGSFLTQFWYLSFSSWQTWQLTLIF